MDAATKTAIPVAAEEDPVPDVDSKEAVVSSIGTGAAADVPALEASVVSSIGTGAGADVSALEEAVVSSIGTVAGADVRAPEEAVVASSIRTGAGADVSALDEAVVSSTGMGAGADVPAPEEAVVSSIGTGAGADVPAPEEAVISSTGTEAGADVPAPEEAVVSSSGTGAGADVPPPEEAVISSTGTVAGADVPAPEEAVVSSIGSFPTSTTGATISNRNMSPQYPLIESRARRVTSVVAGGISTPPKVRVKGCSVSCGCPNSRVPNTVPSFARSCHALAYWSHPVSYGDDTVAAIVYVLVEVSVAEASITWAQLSFVSCALAVRRNRRNTNMHLGVVCMISFDCALMSFLEISNTRSGMVRALGIRKGDVA